MKTVKAPKTSPMKKFSRSIQAMVVLLALCAPIAPTPAAAEGLEWPLQATRRLESAIGEWDVRTEILDGLGNVVRTLHGRNRARFLIEGRVVELTSEVPELDRVTKTWMFYSVADRKFYMTSVDANGDFWILSGDLDEYVLISKPKRQTDGTSLTVRFTHTGIEKDSFTAAGETSTDGGETWTPAYRQQMTRR